MKGIKIEFEGTDGAGKTTALKYFIDQARAKGLTVVETREVGNPNVHACVEMRKVVLDPSSNLSGPAMELLFSAMRIENQRWQDNLMASDEAPNLIVSDRGYLSHLAYTDHNVDETFTSDLYQNFMENYSDLPDAVIYFKISTENAAKRIKGRGTSDVIEAKGPGFQDLVRGSFEKYINQYNEQFLVYEVDANETIEGVQDQLDEILNDLLDYGVNSNQKLSQAI